MEQEKGISITKLIFSLLLVAICVFVFYTIYTKVKEKKPNVVNSNNNNASVEKKEFTKLEATKLFERIISDPAPSYSYPTKKGELLLDDMTLEQKLAIIFSNIAPISLYWVKIRAFSSNILSITVNISAR